MLLLLPGLVCLAFAGLRTWSFLHSRKSRKQKKLGLPATITVGLYILGVLFLLGALVTMVLPPDTPPDPTTEPSGTTSQTQQPTNTDPVKDPSTDPGTDPSQGTETAPSQGTETVPTEPQAGWNEDAGGIYYLREDGSRATGWMDLDGKRYYLDENGYTLSGWKGVEGVVRYFRADGSMARGEETIKGVRYFFTSTGEEILIANPWNYIPEGYEVDLTELSVYYSTEGGRVASAIYDDLIKMMDDCNALSGSRCCVISGYRTHEYQTQAFEETVWELMYLEGKTEDKAREEAATRVAIPGTSEHQLGLAVDIIDTQLWALEQEQEDLEAQKWLMAHSWEYGFILRYPKDKIDITGIIYEPWHYRYVGRELAKEIHELGLTLEEYLAALD